MNKTMGTKQLTIFMVVTCMANNSNAIDIAPYKVGQKVNDTEAEELTKHFKQRDKQLWKNPGSKDDLNNHKDAELIAYGIQVLDKTVETIGPKAKDKNKQYSGNSLNCSSCHLKGETQLPGTKYDAIPFTNVSNDYPQFRSRGMSVVTAAARVNGCMVRSMGDGKPLPLESREMKGILAYYDWLAEDTDKSLAMQGTGVPSIDFPDRKADVVAGKKVYEHQCQSCHNKHALGTKAIDYKESGNYQFPPLAGDDSFNNGAGMSRLKNASKFIHANMPLGASSKTPILTVEESYDVAAYILSLPRSVRKDRENDFPDKKFRPVDYPVPEYFNGDAIALEKAKLGPYNK